MDHNADSDLSRWRKRRRLMLAAAFLITLIAVFYTVENWRGKRAWDRCRRQLEAQGEVLDWTAYVPAPVADDQNFYKAPKMREWFVKDNFAIGGRDPTNVPSPFVPAPRKDTTAVVAEAKIILGNTTKGAADTPVLRLADPSAREEAMKLLANAIGPSLPAARGDFLLCAHLSDFKPLELILQTDAAPTVAEVKALFPEHLPATPRESSPHSLTQMSYIEVEPVGKSAFRISFKKPALGAADFLAWTAPLKSDFELVRQSLQRPYARIDCDYERPFAIGIPNFVRMRTAVQILAERAQCHLLLGQPEAAWDELSLLHGLSETLLLKPAGKPLTLVGAMIYVAISGLYTAVIEDGLRLHAWGEPQLQAIEQQLAATDLLSPVIEALREERAATCRTFETTSRRELLKLFEWRASSKWLLALMPRGWYYQNMVFGAAAEQDLFSSIDLTNRLLRPGQLGGLFRQVSPGPAWNSPFRFLVAAAMPNFYKALQNTAFNQTQSDQARIGCLLERFRLAKGSYPDSLEALTPQFATNLPHDVIGGGLLKYRPSGNDNYMLYSVGWNEKDDGGITASSKDEGDWGGELR